MTDKEKIRAYIEKLHQEHRGSEGDSIFRRALRTVLFYIDSMQEEPKECMYSKDNYTDENRKVLCGSCEEECIEKVKEERKRDLSLWSLGDFENNFFEIIKPYKDSRNYKNLCIRLGVWRSELWRWIHWKKRKEEPVAPKALEDMLNAKTAAESLGISQEEHDRIVDELIYGKEPELVDADDLPKEVPVSEVWHDANEEQPEEYRDFAFVDYDDVMWSRYRIEDLCHSWQTYVNMTGMTKWAYTSDLIKL